MRSLPQLGTDRLLDNSVPPTPTQIEGLFSEALASRTMTAFVGSGATVSMGGPRWKELAEELCDLADVDRDALEPHHYVSTISTAVRKLPEDTFRSKLVELFSDKIDVTGSNPITALLDLHIRRFITTNYDTAIERTISQTLGLREFGETAMNPRTLDTNAASSTRHSFTALDRDREFQLRFAAARPSTHTSTEAPKVWHLHGRFDQPSSLVLTQEDYDNLYIRPSRGPDSMLSSRFLGATLGSTPVLFVGYGLNDEDLVRILRIQRNNRKSYEGFPPLFGLFEYQGDETQERRERERYWGQFELARLTYVRWLCGNHLATAQRLTSGCRDCADSRRAAEAWASTATRRHLFCARHRREIQRSSSGCHFCRSMHGAAVAHRLRRLSSLPATGAQRTDVQPLRRTHLQCVIQPGTLAAEFQPGFGDDVANDPIADWAYPFESSAVPAVTIVHGRAGTARSRCAELIACVSTSDNYSIARWDLAESGDISSLIEYLWHELPGAPGLDESRDLAHAFKRLRACRKVLFIDGLEHLLDKGEQAKATSPLARLLLRHISQFESGHKGEPIGRIIVTTEQIPKQLRRKPGPQQPGPQKLPERVVKVPEIPAENATALAKGLGLSVSPEAIQTLVGNLRGAAGVLRIAATWIGRAPGNEQNDRAWELIGLLGGDPGTRRDRVFAHLAAGQPVEYRALLSVTALAFVPMSKDTAKMICAALIEAGAMAPIRRPHNTFCETNFENAWDELVLCGLLLPATQQKCARVISDFGRRQVLDQAGYSDGAAGRSIRPLTGTTSPGPSITAGHQGGNRALAAVDALLDAVQASLEPPKRGADCVEPITLERANEYLRVALGFMRSRFEARSATPSVQVNRVLRRELRILNLSRQLAQGFWHISHPGHTADFTTDPHEPPEEHGSHAVTNQATFTLAELGWLYNDISIGLYATGRTDQAAAAYANGHEVHHLLSHRIGFEAYQAQSRLHFGHLAIARGDLLRADYFLDRTADVVGQFTGRDREDMTARISGYRAIIAHLKNDPGTSERLFRLALKHYLGGKRPADLNRRATSKFLTHFSYLLMAKGLTDECSAYLREARGLAEGSFATDLHVFAMLAEAELLRRTHQLEAASERLTTARAMAQGSDLRRMMVEVELQDAQLHLARGETTWAWRTGMEMLRTATAVGLMLRQTRAIELLGDIAQAQGHRDEAVECYKVAYQRARRQDYLRRLSSVSQSLERLDESPSTIIDPPPAAEAVTEARPSEPPDDPPDSTLIDLTDTPARSDR